MADYLDSLVARGIVSQDALGAARQRAMAQNGGDPDPFATRDPYAYSPNPQIYEDASNFGRGGISGVLKGRGVNTPGLPQWLTDALDNPDNQAAMPGLGMAASWAPRMRALLAGGRTVSQIADDIGVSRTEILRQINNQSKVKTLGLKNASYVTGREYRNAGSMATRKEYEALKSDPSFEAEPDWFKDEMRQ